MSLILSGWFEEAKSEAVLFECSGAMTGSSAGSNGLPCVTARRQTEPANDVASTFRRDRAPIEQIASEQYDAGKLRPVIQGGNLLPQAERISPQGRVPFTEVFTL
ncbi:hypothetical protein [Bradyrhizobium sp. USDA 336]|uniref:hypothetical protein n=1 Tax=Bradyrhizobium sp. USDA 336 TaxID=3156311 RepID=UPI0038358C9A